MIIQLHDIHHIQIQNILLQANELISKSIEKCFGLIPHIFIILLSLLVTIKYYIFGKI